jgi:hypothetical protein
VTNLTRRIEQLEGAAVSHDLPTFVVVLEASFRRQVSDDP